MCATIIPINDFKNAVRDAEKSKTEEDGAHRARFLPCIFVFLCPCSVTGFFRAAKREEWYVGTHRAGRSRHCAHAHPPFPRDRGKDQGHRFLPVGHSPPRRTHRPPRAGSRAEILRRLRALRRHRHRDLPRRFGQRLFRAGRQAQRPRLFGGRQDGGAVRRCPAYGQERPCRHRSHLRSWQTRPHHAACPVRPRRQGNACQSRFRRQKHPHFAAGIYRCPPS